MARNEKQGDKDSIAAASANYFCSDKIASPSFLFVLSSNRPITPETIWQRCLLGFGRIENLIFVPGRRQCGGG